MGKDRGMGRSRSRDRSKASKRMCMNRIEGLIKSLRMKKGYDIVSSEGDHSLLLSDFLDSDEVIIL